MDYRHLFLNKYYVFMGIFCLATILVGACVIFGIRKLSNIDKIAMLIAGSIFLFLIVIPFVKDKPLIDSGTYIQEYGVVKNDVHVGYMRYISTIWVELGGEEMNLYIAYIDDGIHTGDSVKVTYLPNTKFAVIEKSK